MIDGVAEDLAMLLARGPTIAGNAVAIIRRVDPYIGTVRRVVDDPAFDAVAGRVQTIINLPGAPSSSTSKDVGLSKIVPILDTYIYVRRNPWVPWVAIGAAVALIGGIGYRMGRRRK